ncbi:hypothetical protein KI387_017920, partial [Taxus chinensis]
ITMMDLGRVTIEGAQQDAQDAMNVLCQKLKETKVSRDELKDKVEQLTEVLLKLSMPSQSTLSSSTPTPIRFDFSSVPVIENINEKGRM